MSDSKYTMEEAERLVGSHDASAEVAKLRARVAELEKGTNLVTTDTEKRLLADLAARDARVAELEALVEPWHRCAQALADEVDVLVRCKVIDARSPAADALLDVRNPPRSLRSDRLTALTAEREEWKARAEAEMQQRIDISNTYFAHRDELKVQRDEAAASAERMREALTAIGKVHILGPLTSEQGQQMVALSNMALRAALATPAPAWLRERDRALAMKVAEAVAEKLAGHIVLINPETMVVVAYDLKMFEPIVDSCLQEKP